MSHLAATVARRLPAGLFAAALRSPIAMKERALIARLAAETPDEVQDWLLTKAERTLRRARTTVAAYGDYPSDFARVPILHKADVADRADEFTRRAVPRRSVTTGGTSGRPLDLRISLASFVTEWVYIEHAWRRGGIAPSDPKITFRGSSLGRGFGREKIVYQPAYNQFLVSPFDLREEVFRDLLDQVADFRPRAIWGYPSAIATFAQWVAATGPHAALKDVRAVLLASEGALDWQLTLLRDVFDATIVRWYGQSEKAVFASGCTDGSNYHLLPSYGLTEVINGRIIGTGFTNRAMPLLRYDTEDRGSLSPGPCSCGLPFEVLSDVEGRWDQSMFWGANDEPISTTALNFHDRIFGQFAKFQFCQEEAGIVTLFVVAHPGQSNDPGVLGRAVDALQRRVGDALRVKGGFANESALLSVRGKLAMVDQRYVPPPKDTAP